MIAIIYIHIAMIFVMLINGSIFIIYNVDQLKSNEKIVHTVTILITRIV